MEQETIDIVANASLAELMLEIECGKLNELACLCDPNTRRAAELISNRFNERERSLIWRKLCNSCSAPTPTQPTGGTTTAGLPLPPAEKPPAPAPPVIKNEPPPARTCDPNLPPPKSFT